MDSEDKAGIWCLVILFFCFLVYTGDPDIHDALINRINSGVNNNCVGDIESHNTKT